MKGVPSLRLRLLLLFLVSDVLLVAALLAGTFLFTQRRLTGTFDNSLTANAEAIATLAHQENPGPAGPVELEFSDEAMPRFSKGRHPDVFAVLQQDGSVIDKSRLLEKVPAWIGPSRKRVFRDLRISGKSYRGVVMPTRALVENDEAGGTDRGAPILVFFARSRAELDDDLEDILAFTLAAFGATILLSTVAAFGITRRGLLPLRSVADQALEIHADRLDRRLDLGEMPPDLRPLGQAFNDVLARLQGSFDEERRFSADAAHELRTPVAVLKSGIQAALMRAPDQGRDRQSLQNLLEDAHRIESLCEALLLVGREDEEEASVLPVDLFCDEVVASVEALRPVADKSGSNIEFLRPGPTGGEVSCPVHTVRRLVGNLLDNALRHGGQGVRVTVAVEATDSVLRTTVEDDGPGIPADLLPRLFHRFARGDASRTRATGGTGLGLAISRCLAERAGGTLTHEAPSGGRGARFVWDLPLAGSPGGG